MSLDLLLALMLLLDDDSVDVGEEDPEATKAGTVDDGTGLFVIDCVCFVPRLAAAVTP